MWSTLLRSSIIKTLTAILLILSLSQLSCNLFSEKTVFYVSLSGNNSWSGLLDGANKDGTDGPFQSLERAKIAIEELKRADNFPGGGVVVAIRKGVYPGSESLVLSKEHSGLSGAPVIWKSYKGEKVQLVGGKEIKGFAPVSDQKIRKKLKKEAAQNVVFVSLKELGIFDYGEITPRGGPGLELFFKDKRMQLARWPNEGWAKIVDVPQTGKLVYEGNLPHTRFGIPVGRHYGRITYEELQPGTWSNVENIYLHGYWTWDWYDEYLKISKIDKAKKEIYIAEHNSNYGFCKEQKYYALNILEELDQPGEWFLDRKNGDLYFWPPDSLDSGSVFISMLEHPVIKMDTTSWVHIQGLNVEFSRGSGIEVSGGEHNLIAGCTFSNLGDFAVHINGGTNNGVSSCDVYEVAAGGFAINGGDRKTLTPAGNFAVNNHIHHFSQWIRTYQAAISVTGVGNYLAHNLIHDAPHSGIILNGNEHVLEYNELFFLAQETGDVGAFYMGRDWTQRGNIIRYNYFHDLLGPGLHGVNAVYLDDWTSGTTMIGNVFVNAGRGIMIGGGRDNVVENNLFVECRPAVHVDSRGLGWAKYYFDGTTNTLFDRMDAMDFSKPPYSEKYPELLKLYDDEPAIAKYNKISRNVSYLGRWLDLHNGLDLEIVDCQNNVIASPEQEYQNEPDLILQENPGIKWENNKLEFEKDTKVFESGFEEIPFEKIGLYKDAFRTELD